MVIICGSPGPEIYRAGQGRLQAGPVVGGPGTGRRTGMRPRRTAWRTRGPSSRQAAAGSAGRAGPEAGRLQDRRGGLGSVCEAGVPPERPGPRVEDFGKDPEPGRCRMDAARIGGERATGRVRRVTGRAGCRQAVGRADGSDGVVWRGPGVGGLGAPLGHVECSRCVRPESPPGEAPWDWAGMCGLRAPPAVRDGGRDLGFQV